MKKAYYIQPETIVEEIELGNLCDLIVTSPTNRTADITTPYSDKDNSSYQDAWENGSLWGDGANDF